MSEIHTGVEQHLKGKTELLSSIDRLPPTPISPEADKKLSEWGIPSELRAELSELTSSFRYDLVPQKVEGLTNRPIYTARYGGSEYALIPYFFDTNGKLEGQCSDLSDQMLTSAKFQGWIEDVNESLATAGRAQLEWWRLNGLSATHFNYQDKKNPAIRDSHIWLSLTQEGTLDENDRIDIDPSFQAINTPTDNGYRLMEGTYKPDSPESSLTGIVKVGTLRHTINGEKIPDDYHAITIGASKSREFIYGGVFLRDSQDGRLTFALERLYPDGTNRDIFFLDNGQISYNHIAGTLTQEDTDEIKEILQAGKLFMFSEATVGNENLNGFPYPINKDTLTDDATHKIGYGGS